jgi:hypothetical protein
MVPKITRRELAAAVALSTALVAQQPPAAPPPIPANPEEELQAVREQAQRNSVTLAKFDVPTPVEPAVHFHA